MRLRALPSALRAAGVLIVCDMLAFVASSSAPIKYSNITLSGAASRSMDLMSCNSSHCEVVVGSAQGALKAAGMLP